MNGESKLDPAAGGKARWAGTTKKERSEAARKAATARWSADLPRVTHGSDDHPMKIGDVEIPCYVLDNGIRVITHRGLQGAVDMTVTGSAATTAEFVRRFGVMGLDAEKLAERLSNPIEFVPAFGRTAFGYEATVLVDFCDLFLDARRLGGILNKPGERIAARCEILARGFARVGIIALVDEATGYQRDRSRDALAKILEAFIAKEIRDYAKTFDPDFYEEMFRLKGLPFNGTTRRPQYFGHLTNDLVYARLAPGVLKELQERNPAENGRRRAKHFQWLSGQHGHPKLIKHLGAVTALMAISKTWDEFYALLQKNKPKQVECPLYDHLESEGSES